MLAQFQSVVSRRGMQHYCHYLVVLVIHALALVAKRMFLLSLAFQSERIRLTINCLVSKNADVNARDVFGDTPLMYAVGRGNMVALEELLKCEDIDVDVSLP